MPCLPLKLEDLVAAEAESNPKLEDAGDSR
jgi:hypothetical protein